MTAKLKLVTRQLDKEHIWAARALRLKSLWEEGEKFGPTYEDEVRLPYEEWEKRVTPTPDSRAFGQLEGPQLVSHMRVSKWEDDPTGQTAAWGRAYAIPRIRGQRDENGDKLTAPLYIARAKFTFEEHPTYTRTIAYVRQDNPISQQALVKHGAVKIGEGIIDWPGREPALWNYYAIPSHRLSPAQQYETIQELKEILAHLLRAAEPAPRDRYMSAAAAIPAHLKPAADQKNFG